MLHTKIFCAKGIQSRDDFVDDARFNGLNASVRYPETNKISLDILYSAADSDRHNQFLEQYINNPDYTIFYDPKHPKGVKKPFRANVLKNSRKKEEEIALPTIQYLVDDLQYSDLVPPKMKTYYGFPIINNRTESIRPKIGVISLGGFYLESDLQIYWTETCSLSGVLPIVINHLIDNETGDFPIFEQTNESLENTIDIELIGGFCPSAIIHFYSAPNTYTGYYDAFEAAINDDMDIISTSWGQSEERFYGVPELLDQYNTLFENAVTGYHKTKNHYTVITAATGDYGSSDNQYDVADVSQYYPDITIKVPIPHADFPATSPWVTACGGTSLYWDKSIPDGNQESTWFQGGGGQSSHFLRPSYQGPWRSNWPVSPLCKRDTSGQPFARTIPDITFNGDPNSPWVIIFASYESEGAGTSACAPITAGLLGEFYVGSENDQGAPRNGYFGEGFNVNIYRAGSSTSKRLFLGYNVTTDRSPLTNESNPFGYYGAYPDGTPVPENMTFYAVWSDYTAYSFCGGLGVPIGEKVLLYLDNVVCVAFGTHILMENGQYKSIEQIIRGEIVIGYESRKFTVADINKQYISKNSVVDIIEFKPNSLGEGNPSQTLLVTPNHPIFFKGARRPAKAFKMLPNVIEHHGVKPGSILQQTTTDELGPVYYLYDLQFDDDGSYTAEGVVVQSRSPWSNITPLPKELYYDSSRYKEETHWDGFNYPLPLDEQDLIP